MPQRSKGKRRHVTTRVPDALDIDRLAEEAGYGDNLSQYVADFLCAHNGKHALVVGPKRLERQEMLPLSA